MSILSIDKKSTVIIPSLPRDEPKSYLFIGILRIPIYKFENCSPDRQFWPNRAIITFIDKNLRSRNDLGELIREARHHANLSQIELAELAGVSVLPVYQIESGTGNPRFATIIALLDALGFQLAAIPKTAPSDD